MKKYCMIMAMMFFAVHALMAQNVFEVTNISQPNDIYSGEDNEAAVLIRCNHLIPLSFSSTMDKNVEPYMSDLQGNDSLYYIVFPTGKKYRGRELTISAPGYYTYTVGLELEPKQLVSFQIVDPNSLVDAGCYRGHRNKGVLEMKNANYDEARNQFEIARDCSDVNKEENEKNIQLIDTILHYRRIANKSYEQLDYRKSIEYYSRVVELNSYDTFASGRRDESIINFTQDCQATYDRAEYFFNNKEYDKAKALYEIVMEQKCQNYSMAVTRINEIDSYQTARKDHNMVITYEFASGDSPIGLHIGGYKMHKTGGFFEIDFNGKLFDSMRGACSYGDKPEVNLSFGFTHKIANPVWFYIGPGFTYKPYYGDFQEDTYPVKNVPYPDNNKKGLAEKSIQTDKYNLTKYNFAGAVSPTIGIVVKYSYFALRLGYQYRFAINKNTQDYIKANRFTIGIGVAF